MIETPFGWLQQKAGPQQIVLLLDRQGLQFCQYKCLKGIERYYS